MVRPCVLQHQERSSIVNLDPGWKKSCAGRKARAFAMVDQIAISASSGNTVILNKRVDCLADTLPPLCRVIN